jgi:hypothetical protein
MDALAQFLTPIEITLDHIYLDPNNPRFVGSNWHYVSDDDARNPDIQESIRKKLVDEFEVGKLRTNMEINGYLPVDRIIVRKLGEADYMVLEGNRRICAAKLISKYTESGEEISNYVLESLKTIPALEYTGDNTNNNGSWIFQGLRHITGVTDWSSFNKAKLLVEQMEKEGLNLTQVGRRFGLSVVRTFGTMCGVD